MNRVTYGINSPTVEKFKSLGREPFLQTQLAFNGDKGLPEEIRLYIANMDISKSSPSDLLIERHQGEQQLKSATDANIKGKIQQSLNQRGNDLAMQATERRILRAIYSENQLQELLTWFWFNHFNIFQYKGYNNLLLADYEEHAIRPHVLGKFRDLVLATLTHPAMLVYLDNAQNASGAVNESYAREIMELHTLGINGGYKQNDVENLAHILTGVGVDLSGSKCPQGQTKLGSYTPSVQDGLFCYSPNRHDQNAKNFLGHSFPIEGGAEEVVRAVDILVQNPATAKFISRKLAVYFLADNPPESVINDMSRAF